MRRTPSLQRLARALSKAIQSGSTAASTNSVEREERSASTAAQNNCFRVPRGKNVSYVLVVLESLLIVLVGCLRRELKRVGNGVEGRPCHHSERRTQLQYQSGLFRWCNAVVGDRFSSVLGNLWLAGPKGASRS